MNQTPISVRLVVASDQQIDPVVLHEHLWQFLQHFRPVVEGEARTSVTHLHVQGEPA